MGLREKGIGGEEERRKRGKETYRNGQKLV